MTIDEAFKRKLTFSGYSTNAGKVYFFDSDGKLYKISISKHFLSNIDKKIQDAYRRGQIDAKADIRSALGI